MVTPRLVRLASRVLSPKIKVHARPWTEAARESKCWPATFLRSNERFVRRRTATKRVSTNSNKTRVMFTEGEATDEATRLTHWKGGVGRVVSFWGRAGKYDVKWKHKPKQTLQQQTEGDGGETKTNLIQSDCVRKKRRSSSTPSQFPVSFVVLPFVVPGWSLLRWTADGCSQHLVRHVVKCAATLV